MSIFDKDLTINEPSHLSEIFFGMGCFWGAERKFWQLDVCTQQLLDTLGVMPKIQIMKPFAMAIQVTLKL